MLSERGTMRKIKRTKYLSSALLLLLLLILSACAPDPDFELYKGKPLRIVVVGEPPEVKEEQVKFTKISFDKMTNKELNSFDAVFIMEENLFEAADDQYVDVYLDSTIPFFFIGTDNFIPFLEKDMKYDKSMNWSSGNSYAVGILIQDDALKKWEYGLYNDEKKEEYIKDVYSRIFKTIDELNQ